MRKHVGIRSAWEEKTVQFLSSSDKFPHKYGAQNSCGNSSPREITAKFTMKL